MHPSRIAMILLQQNNLKRTLATFLQRVIRINIFLYILTRILSARRIEARETRRRNRKKTPSRNPSPSLTAMETATDHLTTMSTADIKRAVKGPNMQSAETQGTTDITQAQAVSLALSQIDKAHVRNITSFQSTHTY
jgi:hypothetical protein